MFYPEIRSAMKLEDFHHIENDVWYGTFGKRHGSLVFHILSGFTLITAPKSKQKAKSDD